MRAKFKLEFTPRFERRFKSLDREIQIRILREVQILTGTPTPGRCFEAIGGTSTLLELEITEFSIWFQRTS